MTDTLKVNVEELIARSDALRDEFESFDDMIDEVIRIVLAADRSHQDLVTMTTLGFLMSIAGLSQMGLDWETSTDKVLQLVESGMCTFFFNVSEAEGLEVRMSSGDGRSATFMVHREDS